MYLNHVMKEKAAELVHRMNVRNKKSERLKLKPAQEDRDAC